MSEQSALLALRRFLFVLMLLGISCLIIYRNGYLLLMGNAVSASVIAEGTSTREVCPQKSLLCDLTGVGKRTETIKSFTLKVDDNLLIISYSGELKVGQYKKLLVDKSNSNNFQIVEKGYFVLYLWTLVGILLFICCVQYLLKSKFLYR